MESGINQWKKAWWDQKCHDCGARMGEVHKEGCDMARCPVCGHQDVSCDCTKESKQHAHYKPFIETVVTCPICGDVYPDMFGVEDEEWQKYVPPELQHSVICKYCYKQLKKRMPDGWASVKR